MDQQKIGECIYDHLYASTSDEVPNFFDDAQHLMPDFVGNTQDFDALCKDCDGFWRGIICWLSNTSISGQKR